MSGMSELARDVSKKFYLTNFDAKALLMYSFQDIATRILSGERVSIHYVGTVYLDERGVIQFQPDRALSFNAKQQFRNEMKTQLNVLSRLLLEDDDLDQVED